jgi:hypothetical protein
MAASQSGIQIEKSLIDCKTIYIHTLTDHSPTNVGTVVILILILLLLLLLPRSKYPELQTLHWPGRSILSPSTAFASQAALCAEAGLMSTSKKCLAPTNLQITGWDRALTVRDDNRSVASVIPCLKFELFLCDLCELSGERS